jgi:hypothetical protein
MMVMSFLAFVYFVNEARQDFDDKFIINCIIKLLFLFFILLPLPFLILGYNYSLYNSTLFFFAFTGVGAALGLFNHKIFKIGV